jgi:hypothetical protein
MSTTFTFRVIVDSHVPPARVEADFFRETARPNVQTSRSACWHGPRPMTLPHAIFVSAFSGIKPDAGLQTPERCGQVFDPAPAPALGLEVPRGEDLRTGNRTGNAVRRPQEPVATGNPSSPIPGAPRAKLQNGRRMERSVSKRASPKAGPKGRCRPSFWPRACSRAPSSAALPRMDFYLR